MRFSIQSTDRMKAHVLVLNHDYSALTVCTVRRAVVLVHLNKADLVESVPDYFLRSPSIKLPCPSIVRLRGYVRVPYRNIMLSREPLAKPLPSDFGAGTSSY
ncbi:MAG: hypothetical protein F4Z62_02565, partial [Rhodothermaceae bacterium]|nr:hypothetical protein [Rhodothermaceae bacterium]